jgi:hypothetical protein
MRFRQMATYQGVPYEAGVGPTGSDVVLFAACPPPEELGFEPAPGHWRKRVIRAEVDVLWESRPVGTFHGEPCLVLDDLGDRLHIGYLGQDGRRARELGYWQVDRGVFELLTPRDEVTGLTEEKVEKGLPPRTATATAPPMPSYPYGGAQYPPAPAAAPVSPAARGRNGAPGYLSDPALTPAGAWTGNGGPASAGGGRGGTGPHSSGPRTGPGRNGTGAHRSDPLTSKNWNGGGSPSPDPLTSKNWNGGGSPSPDPLTSKNWNGGGSPGPDPPTSGWSDNGSPYPPASPGGPASNGLASWSSMTPAATAVPPRATGSGYAARASEFDTPAAGIGRRRHAGRRSARKQRVPTRAIFSELADLAAIPRSAYALEHEADGAMCLLRTEDGFEVFSAADGARHEVRTFDDEEAAYFYLFGVLAAEAVRNRSLLPPR